MNTQETKRGYHFTAGTLRNGYPIPEIGQWISVAGPIIPCESGLHMSEHPFDALQYAPGCKLHLVEIRGDLQSHGNPIDKWVGRERKIIASIDSTEVLCAWARLCALRVANLWDCQDVVRRYLQTGDESIMNEARSAAAYAAYSDKSAAYYAAYAAYSAAYYTAYYASYSAAYYTAYYSANFAADEVYSATLAAAYYADKSATMEGVIEKLQELVDEAFKKELSK